MYCVIIRYIKAINISKIISISNMLPNCKLVVIVLLCAATIKVDLASIVQAPKAANVDWWKNAVIYKIYTRTFNDGDNNDGIGDLQGIIDKLDYLKASGVTAIWLPPIQKSADDPKVDYDYEITDYMELNREFGKDRTFNNLIKRGHKKGIKILLEIVPNHSSNKHPWFVESAKELENEFTDYYVWKNGTPETPPNNWISHFDKSAWTYNTVRQAWYLHQFGEDQPDLNYHTPAVKDKMKEVLKYWLDLGVDGFVIADAPFLVEDINLTNEESSGVRNKDEYESLIHDKTSNLEATYDIIAQWRKYIDDYSNGKPSEDPRILITKSHTDLDKAVLYCGTEAKKGAHFTYNFLLETELKTELKAQSILEVIEKWEITMPPECVANWVLGHHDLYRVASRFRPELVDGLNVLLSFLPGIMITYNGEEIGQENGEVQFTECKDPIACQTKENYETITRDFERTPFHWDESTNAGFTTSDTPWLPVSKVHTTNNLKLQNRTAYPSHYHTYQDLTKLRQEYGFSTATVNYQVLTENVLALIRKDVNGTAYIALINTSHKNETVNLSQIAKFEKYLQVVVANTDSKKHNMILLPDGIVLNPYESIIVKALPIVEEGKSDWWEHAVVYQIYPLSFKDNNNDGYGDIKGIISKLDYLKETGINVAWLSPIYESPQVDAGYDISNYRAIDPRFGTDYDFDKMVKKAHEFGIKIVMDFVPNHSSDKHEWFLKSEAGEEEFKDFYVWHPGKNDGEDPPNNWISLFKGSAWTKSEKRGLWYLHQFAKEQPDLNYRNDRVVAEMKDILKFWMDRGVDGFRMDAVPYLVEHEEFPDELPSNIGAPGEHISLLHNYTSDLDGTFDMIYQWREYIDDYTKLHGGDARILMTEAYTDIVNTMKYYGNDERDGGHFTFNFQLITRLKRELNATQIVEAVDEWMDHMPESRIANWVLGNHDQHRVASRFDSKNVDGFNMLIALLPGVMVTYNGEEIGQENGEVTWEQGEDPSACTAPEDFDKISRDFERTPFHWDNTVNAGFNDGNETWLPVSKKYVHLNLAAQNIPDKQSHYNVYKQLMVLRKNPTTSTGAFEIKTLSNNVLAVIRSLEGGDTFILIFNVGNEVENIEINAALSTVTPYVEIKAMSIESYHYVGELIASEKLILNAHESIIVATTLEEPTTPAPGGGGEGEGEGGGGGAAEITIPFVSLIITLICSILIR